MPKVSIIIPTYNERVNIFNVLYTTQEVLKKNNIDGEIIVVDDNSLDGTADAARCLGRLYNNIRVLIRKKMKGMDTALRFGYNHAKGDIIICMDCDLSHDPHQIPQFIEKINEGYDIVIGSRYIENASYKNKRLKYFVSRAGNFFMSNLSQIPIHDFTNGYRAFKKSVLKNIKVKSRGNSFFMEFIVNAYKNNYRMVEIPVNYIDREIGKSKLKLHKESIRVLMNFIKLGQIRIDAKIVLLFLLSCLIFSVNIPNLYMHPEFGEQNYIAQEILGGHPVFSTSVFPYPPMVFFVNALWLKIFFFLPGYLAIRLGGLILGVSTVLLLFRIIKKYTKNERLSLYSALIMLSFVVFVEYFLNMSAKTLLIFLSMSIFAFLFREKHFLAGLMTTLCFMTWQPGLIFVFGALSYYFLTRKGVKTYARYFSGFGLTLSVFLLYFVLSGTLTQFIDYNFLFVFTWKEKYFWAKNSFLASIKPLLGDCNTSVLFLIIPAFSIFFIDLHKINKHKEIFSFILPYFLLFLYVLSMDFQGGEDLLPLIPMVALANAVVLNKVNKFISIAIVLLFIVPLFQPVYPPNPFMLDMRRTKTMNDIFAVIGNYSYQEVIYYGLLRRVGREINIQQQLKIAEYVNNNMNKTDSVFSLNGADILFMSGKRNIIKHFQLTSSTFITFAVEEDKKNPGFIDGMREQIIESNPKFILAWMYTGTKGIEFLNLEEFINANYEKIDLNPYYAVWERSDNN